ncbi:hypothetical protein V2J09_013828 [Rumex salicifolius]
MATQNAVVSDTVLSPHFSLPRFGTKINPWIDSLRSSSPTHLNSSSSSSSYLLRLHPSALQMFEQITEASMGKQVVLFLDYDGTLTPIIDDPERAFMSDEMRSAVRELAKLFPTAIVTGRSRDKVYNFVKLAELYYAGSHGMDITGPTKGHKYSKIQGNRSVLFQPASNFLPMIDQVYKALIEKTKTIPGVNVENNKFCVSVHFRRVDDKRWEELAEQVREVLTGYPKLILTQGRKVLEVRPCIKWDKGNAVEFLLESLELAKSENVLPIYIGDDRTDEDAFKVLGKRKQGFGILVSKVAKETNAAYTLREPSEVKCFLQRLVEWKRKSSSSSRRRGYCF